jgi:hypothetical protein
LNQMFCAGWLLVGFWLMLGKLRVNR